MRVLHLADLHINFTGPRAEECRRILDWIPPAAAQLEPKPDAVVIAGDVFDRRSTPKERIYLADFLCRLSETAKVFMISGNHDDRDDLALFRKEYGWMAGAEVVLGPSVFSHAGAGLAFLPWPTFGALVQPGSTDSIAARREAARAALIDVVRGFSNDNLIDPNKTCLLVAHAAVTGASMDSGQPVCGAEEVSLTADELLESGAAGVALGHIHLQQQMTNVYGRPVIYAGSPFRGSFGEAAGEKGGVIWDWDAEIKSWNLSRWPAPARRMILLEGPWAPEGQPLPEVAEKTVPNLLEEVRDSDVRLRIHFPAESREAMRAANAEQIEKVRGLAHSLTVEEIPTVVSRTRCVEITKARTPIDKLRAWAEAAGLAVPAGVEAKLAELEKEARP